MARVLSRSATPCRWCVRPRREFEFADGFRLIVCYTCDADLERRLAARYGLGGT